MRTIISRLPNGRFKIHYGLAQVEADESFIARLLIEQIEDVLRAAQGDAVSFEFTGSIPERELSNVLHELENVRKTKEALQRTYENRKGTPLRDLREAYDRWVTAAYTQRLTPLYQALGFETDGREAA